MSRTFFISVICNYNFVVNLLFNSLIWQLRDSFYSHIFGLEIDLFTLQPGAVPIEIPSKKKVRVTRRTKYIVTHRNRKFK